MQDTLGIGMTQIIVSALDWNLQNGEGFFLQTLQ